MSPHPHKMRILAENLYNEENNILFIAYHPMLISNWM